MTEISSTRAPARQGAPGPRHDELAMEWPDVERFLRDWGDRGHSAQAVERYRCGLKRLYDSLPEGRPIRRDTVRQWRDRLLREGFAPSTANLYVSACNSWLGYMGKREYQLRGQLDGAKARAGLTREEYFRLLFAARARGQEKLFLLIKVLGSTGLYVNELPGVTVEAVKAGFLTGRESGAERKIRLTEGLRGELLAYAQKKNRVAGPVFRAQDGGVLGRTTVAIQIRSLGREAGIPDGKATPSGLRLMYLANRARIEADAARIVEQTMDRQLEQEQLFVGWEAASD